MRKEKGELPWANIRFESKTQSNQFFRSVVPEGVGIPGSFEEVESVKCEEANNIHETDLANKTTPRLGAIISLKHRVAHL